MFDLQQQDNGKAIVLMLGDFVQDLILLIGYDDSALADLLVLIVHQNRQTHFLYAHPETLSQILYLKLEHNGLLVEFDIVKVFVLKEFKHLLILRVRL